MRASLARAAARCVRPPRAAAGLPRSAASAAPARAASSSSTSAASPSPSAPSLPSTPAIAFDIDGVLLRGRSLLPTARAALAKVTSQADGGAHPDAGGVPHVYFTNGGGVTEAAKAAQLSSLFGVRVLPEAVVLSHTPMRSLVNTHAEGLMLVLGSTDVRAVARAYGFKHVLIPEDIVAKYPDLVPHLTNNGMPTFKEAPLTQYSDEHASIAAIMVLHDPIEWYRDLQVVLDVLTTQRAHGVPPPQLFFSNPDFLYSGAAPRPRLAAGAFRVCLEALYKQYTGGEALNYTLFGKPHAVTYRHAEKLLEEQAAASGRRISRIYGIGDNPASDIRGANDAGERWTSVLVRSGTIARSSDPKEQAKKEVECVDEAVEWILKGGDHAQGKE